MIMTTMSFSKLACEKGGTKNKNFETGYSKARVDPVVKNRIANLRTVDGVAERALFCYFCGVAGEKRWSVIA